MGEVVSPSADGMAAVRTARGVESVATALIDPVAAGELVLVHAGTAISRIEEDAVTALATMQWGHRLRGTKR